MRGPALAALMLALTAAVSAQPRLAFDAPRHDFGTFEEDEVVTHVFRFANAGDAALRIVEITAACGCTTPEWTQDPIAPGDSGSVSVAYDSAGRPGLFEKTVRVIPEAGEAVTLRLTGEVISAFVARGIPVGSLTFESVREDLGDIASAQEIQTVFRFQHRGERPLRILGVETSHEGIRVVFPQRPVFPGDVAAVLVYADEADLGSDVDLAVTVLTDDPTEPEKSVQILARIPE
ncbi:MAG: DUF1573 domain-containing protein [Bacteroidota bacterium]